MKLKTKLTPLVKMHFKDTLNLVLTVIMRIERMLCQLTNFICLIGPTVDRKTNRLAQIR